jgi:hypothetical protein
MRKLLWRASRLTNALDGTFKKEISKKEYSDTTTYKILFTTTIIIIVIITTP